MLWAQLDDEARTTPALLKYITCGTTFTARVKPGACKSGTVTYPLDRHITIALHTLTTLLSRTHVRLRIATDYTLESRAPRAINNTPFPRRALQPSCFPPPDSFHINHPATGGPETRLPSADYSKSARTASSSSLWTPNTPHAPLPRCSPSVPPDQAPLRATWSSTPAYCPRKQHDSSTARSSMTGVRTTWSKIACRGRHSASRLCLGRI